MRYFKVENGLLIEISAAEAEGKPHRQELMLSARVLLTEVELAERAAAAEVAKIEATTRDKAAADALAVAQAKLDKLGITKDDLAALGFKR